MNLDETLAEAMRRAADRVAVNPSPTEPTIRRGQAARRRRRTASTAAMTLAVVGAVAVPTWLAAGSHTPGPQQPPLTQITGTQQPGPAVRTVADGERVTLHSGAVLWLTDQGLWLATSALSIDHPDHLSLPSAGVAAIAGTAGSTTVWAGIYHGPGKAASITLELNGHPLTTEVLALPGAPGWSVFVVEGEALRVDSVKPTVSVYAADGAVLATQRL
ncbi:hypothetical protein ACFQ9X_20645 [Catenulispora yoronensis]